MSTEVKQLALKHSELEAKNTGMLMKLKYTS